jgi:hypothetical protein
MIGRSKCRVGVVVDSSMLEVEIRAWEMMVIRALWGIVFQSQCVI